MDSKNTTDDNNVMLGWAVSMSPVGNANVKDHFGNSGNTPTEIGWALRYFTGNHDYEWGNDVEVPKNI